jgi:hypothetical protein
MESKWGYRAILLGVVLVVGTAGCLATQDTDPPSGTTTVATTTAVSADSTTATGQEETVVDGQASYPPGFDQSGYVDRQSALGSHLQALQRQSFTSTTTVDGGATTIVVTANPETEMVRKVRREGGTTAGDFYFDGQTGQAPDLSTGSNAFYGDVSTFQRAIVYDGQYELVFGVELTDPQVSLRGDQTVFTYEVAGPAHEGNLTVTARGLIVQYTVRPTDQQGRSVDYRVTDIGTTSVAVPDWADG